jgi:threonine dehydrogenase-like Zn-dependent dehydrogenase
MAYGNQLSGGADIVFDCLGNQDSIAEALRIVKPRGQVTLLGMPNNVQLNLTTLWHREVHLAGMYGYGTDTLPDGTKKRTFAIALDLVEQMKLGRLVSAVYPLRDYRTALEHAANSGRRGSIKIAFDLRQEKDRTTL